MKKLILLLFIPFISFSQTYDDIMAIDSEEMFVRTMIENGYERMLKDTPEDVIVYAHSPYYEDDEPRSTIWVHHTQIDNVVIVLFEVETIRDFYAQDDDISYDKVFDTVKKKCDYVALQPNINVEGSQMVVYECEAKQRFAFDQRDGTGYIEYYYPFD